MPTKPKPKPPAEAEDTGEPSIELVEIPFCGQTFTVPREMDEWETDACIALSKAIATRYLEAAVSAINLSLGDAQYEQLTALGTKRRDVTEFLAVLLDVVHRECTQ